MAVRSRDISTRHIHWPRSIRIVPSRFPPVNLFERVTDPADLEAVLAVESLTNDRLRDEVGDIRLVSPEDRVTGPGAGYIMAPFTHVSPIGGRFTDGTYGAYYTARNRDTAVAETVYHRERFLAATEEPAMELDMRVLVANLSGDLHDVRGMREQLPEVYHADDYAGSQGLARRLRAEGSRGIAHDSVRHPGGECAAVFRPPILSRCRQSAHLGYVWDGTRISAVYEKRILRG